MHDPRAWSAQGRAGGVRTGSCQDAIFNDVGHGIGEDALGKAAAGPGGGGPDNVGADQEVIGILGHHRAAAGGAIAEGGGGGVFGDHVIDATVFEDPNVRRGGGGVESDGEGVGAG